VSGYACVRCVGRCVVCFAVVCLACVWGDVREVCGMCTGDVCAGCVREICGMLGLL